MVTTARSEALIGLAPVSGVAYGKIISDLAMTIALGADCLADAAVLRAQPGLAGAVASDPVISRLAAALAAEGPRALKASAQPRCGPGAGLGARRGPRTWRGWEPDPGRPRRHDCARAQTRNSPNPTTKGLAITRLLGYCENTGEPLAGMLRRGSTGPNTAADHLQVLGDAIAALPPKYRRRLMVTADGAGASHGLIARLDALASRPAHQLVYSAGWDLGRARAHRDHRCARAGLAPRGQSSRRGPGTPCW
ncbi:MAG: hypothetical protein ACLPKI_20530 [Streptosporangiaceae bacterium]